MNHILKREKEKRNKLSLKCIKDYNGPGNQADSILNRAK